MQQILPSFLLIPQHKAEGDSGQYSAAMPPVVDAGNYETENEQKNDPDAYLLIEGLAVNPTAAMSIVKNRANKAAYSSRGADGPIYLKDVGYPEPEDPTQRVDGEHPIEAEFTDDNRCKLAECNHIEEDM